MIDEEELRRDLHAAATCTYAYPEGRFDGRGIVICAGGARLFTGAWILIHQLRAVGCGLPIELWYIGAAEMGPPMRGLLAELGVEAVDALEVARRHPSPDFVGWSLKSYAVKHSRFEEVLLLDADNGVVSDPGALFLDPEYSRTGALFWPDAARIALDNRIWTIAGLAPTQLSLESGQLLVNKRMAWEPLCLANWMNERSQDVYVVLYGDKDTFLIAWRLLKRDFALVPHAPRRYADSLAQFGPDGRPLFQHRTNAKWSLLGPNPSIAGFEERAALGWLAQLRTLWDGWVFNPPARSELARSREAVLAGRCLELVEAGEETLRVRLGADHRLLEGARPGFVYWHIEDTANGEALVFSGAGCVHSVAMATGDGFWRGRRMGSRGGAVEIRTYATPPGPAELRDEDATTWIESLLAPYLALSADAETCRDLEGAARSLLRADRATGLQLTEWAKARLSPRFLSAVNRAAAEVGSLGSRRNEASDLTGGGIFQRWRYERL